jgi:hypothetical protein
MPAQANSSRDSILKTLHKNRAGGVSQGEGPKFKSQYCKKNKINLDCLDRLPVKIWALKLIQVRTQKDNGSEEIVIIISEKE